MNQDEEEDDDDDEGDYGQDSDNALNLWTSLKIWQADALN